MDGRLVVLCIVFGVWYLPDGTLKYLVALCGLTDVGYFDQKRIIVFLGSYPGR